MQLGKAKSWNSQRRFGFIISDDDEEIFVNINDLHPTLKGKVLDEGLRVKFDIKSDMKGERAVNVRAAK